MRRKDVMALHAGPENRATNPLERGIDLLDASKQSPDSARALRIICNDCKVSQMSSVKNEGIHLLKSNLYRFI